MPRPKNPRCIRFSPSVLYYKPRGVPLSELEEVSLAADELEALRLHDVEGHEQTAAAKKMKISQPTYARTLDRAYKKIAGALVGGKAIRIEKDK